MAPHESLENWVTKKKSSRAQDPPPSKAFGNPGLFRIKLFRRWLGDILTLIGLGGVREFHRVFLFARSVFA